MTFFSFLLKKCHKYKVEAVILALPTNGVSLLEKGSVKEKSY